MVKASSSEAQMRKSYSANVISLPRLPGAPVGAQSQRLQWKEAHAGKLPTLRLDEPPLLGSRKLGEVEETSFRDACARDLGATGSSVGVTWQDRARQLASRPNKYKRITPAERRLNSQAALAADQQFVQQQLLETVELPCEREARQQELNDHQWKALFAPIKSARSLLPAAFGGRFPLLGVDSAGQRLGTALEPPVLSTEEMDDLVRVAGLFQKLATPNGTPGPPVLGRSLFCRFICGLSGLSIAPGERTWLAKAAELFDAMAEKHSYASPSGYIVGFSLLYATSAQSKLPELAALPLCKLFARLLLHMMEEVRSLGVGENEERLAKECEAKRRFFDVLLPQAEKYATERIHFVQARIEMGGPPRPGMAAAGPGVSGPSPSAKEVQLKEKPAEAKKALPPKEGRLGRRRRLDSDSSDGASDSEREGPGLDGTIGGTEVEDAAAAAALYAHTFAVQKGELLMSQLLEPEIVHFIAQFSGLFEDIFEAYRDIPVMGLEGHMSLLAFLRVCDDFGLFPAIVDFQTIQWLYSSAEGCSAVESRRGRSRESKCGASVAGGQGGKGRGKRRGFSVPLQDEKFLFCGKWFKSHLKWLTKDFLEMGQHELVAASLLWAVSEWMDSRRLSIAELIAFLDRDSSGALSFDEVRVAIDFMCFEDPPTPDDIRQMMALISAPATSVAVPLPSEERVEVECIHMALNAVSKQREHRDRAANCFLKDFSKMTRAESNACIFLRGLWDLLESKNLTPEDLFNQLDVDGSGTLTADELTRQVQRRLKMQARPTAALSIESPFEMLDTNHDGQVSKHEFCEVLEQTRQAQQRKALYEEKHPIFLSTTAADATRDPNSVFGMKAFVECLLKVALVHLGYHGTAAQAEQPAFVKALWLLVYMHWQFQRARERASRVASEEAAFKAPRPPSSYTDKASRRNPKCILPMQRLLKYHPRMFIDAPETPPALQMPPWARAFSPGCSLNSATKRTSRGWGCFADPALHACLAAYDKGRPAADGERSLDRMLLAAATGNQG